jgi:hypothetical protein
MEAAAHEQNCQPEAREPEAAQNEAWAFRLGHSRSAVLDSLRSPESNRGYQHAMDEFIEWYCSEPRLSFNKTVVT